MDHPTYFFVWTKPKGQEYITRVCGWNKKSVMREAERNNDMAWKKIYRRGGRIVKVKMTLQ